MRTKKCSECKNIKDMSEFYKNRNKKDGLRYECKQCVTEYKRNHKKEIAEYNKLYQKNHRKEHIERNKKYFRKRFQNDAKFRMKNNVSRLINNKIKRRGASKNGKSTFSFLRYTVEELMAHLEKLFKPGMTWENRSAWHIDHVKPDSKFNYTSVEDEEFQKCWALENLQPLWAKENKEKSNRY